jgi:hypothetical protein
MSNLFGVFVKRLKLNINFLRCCSYENSRRQTHRHFSLPTPAGQAGQAWQIKYFKALRAAEAL